MWFCRTVETSLEAWIVVGVVIFGAVFVLCFTWIMFFYAMHRNYKEYDEFLQVYFLSM